MIDKELQDELLAAIERSGSTAAKKLINSNLQHILSYSSGMPRMQTNVVKRFSLISEIPSELSFLSSLEIRCAVCRKVINYPCWYYIKKFSVNEFHYFVCFSETSPLQPNTSCYKR